MPGHAESRSFVPAMGVDHLLPLYDIVARLAGVKALHSAVVAAAELRPGLRVLDVGCGTGSLVVTTRSVIPTSRSGSTPTNAR
jgi:ubiquinone/menaquinone biosynthesis C-methylase UbiE